MAKKIENKETKNKSRVAKEQFQMKSVKGRPVVVKSCVTNSVSRDSTSTDRADRFQMMLIIKLGDFNTIRLTVVLSPNGLAVLHAANYRIGPEFR